MAVALGWHGSLAGNLSPWGLAARANHSVSRSVPHLHSSTRNVTLHPNLIIKDASGLVLI